jgi:hypothetical protein
MIPRGSSRAGDKGASAGEAGTVRDFGKMNEKLRYSLLTAIKIDEQKRLEYIKRKPTIETKRQQTLIGGEEAKKPWQPIVR